MEPPAGPEPGLERDGGCVGALRAAGDVAGLHVEGPVGRELVAACQQLPHDCFPTRRAEGRNPRAPLDLEVPTLVTDRPRVIGARVRELLRRRLWLVAPGGVRVALLEPAGEVRDSGAGVPDEPEIRGVVLHRPVGRGQAYVLQRFNGDLLLDPVRAIPRR